MRRTKCVIGSPDKADCPLVEAINAFRSVIPPANEDKCVRLDCEREVSDRYFALALRRISSFFFD